MELTARELLIQLYQTAIDAVDGRFVVQRWSREHPAYQPTHIIAIGKAASAMLQGALDSYAHIQSALLITDARALPRVFKKDKRLGIHVSSHPIPDESSLEAGDALLRFVSNTDEDARILFLISGGSSSLVEVLHPQFELTDLRSLNQYLLASGKPIHAMNAWRKRLSQIKGGGLQSFLGERQCVQLLISDVRGDDASVIGSGLLVQNRHAVDEDAVLSELCGVEPADTIATAGLAEVETHVIATLDMALRSAAQEVSAHELVCVHHPHFIEGEARSQAENISTLLQQGEPGVYLFGGETTVTLPETPGMGGRNQTLALALSATLEGSDICVLCAGTDGVDGNTPCAGAVITGNTATQARQMGFDIQQELDRANAGTVLMATGDLFKPGASNTNVMDVIIAYKRS